MKDINVIDSWQAHLPVQFASNMELIRRKWHWSCDWQRATPDSHVQNKSVVFAPLAILFTLAVPLFRFTLQQKR